MLLFTIHDQPSYTMMFFALTYRTQKFHPHSSIKKCLKFIYAVLIQIDINLVNRFNHILLCCKREHSVTISEFTTLDKHDLTKCTGRIIISYPERSLWKTLCFGSVTHLRSHYLKTLRGMLHTIHANMRIKTSYL